ncbi:MAG TPA: hypothetical protein VKG38_16360, partial [Solirubrobacteraceae bacterium]|nr:hypothetical protein [Solirubrobacteraceae bacterium]
VLPGTTIGEYGVVGSGSVVRGKVDPYTVVAGNPAKPIRERARADFRYVPSNVPQHRKNIRS